MNESLSETYTYLYHTIIEELLSQIVRSNPNYYVRRKIDNMDFPIALEHKFYEYRKRAQKNMSSQRLDRHKLASCICGAIIEIKPLFGKGTAKNANELLALRTGLSTVKAYMIYGAIHKLQMPYEEKDKFRKYLTEKFMINFHPIFVMQDRMRKILQTPCTNHIPYARSSEKNASIMIFGRTLSFFTIWSFIISPHLHLHARII